MSDRLDRIENLLESHGMAMADIRTRQEIMQLQQERTQLQQERTQLQIETLVNQGTEINKKIDRTSAIVAELASIVFDTTARQQDHENRINRIEQE